MRIERRRPAGWPLALLCALAVTATVAEERALGRQDFAVGFSVEHDAVLPYFELELPAEAYRAAVDPGLADLRVFDADGEVVRHALLPPAAAAPPPTVQVLPLFPLTAAPPGAARETRIAIAGDGRLVTVTAAPVAAAERVTGWVMDAAAVAGRIDRIELEDAGDGAPVADFALDGSRDLVDWTTLLPRASLVRLDHAGHVLRQARFELGVGDYPYLRLRWLDPARAPTLTAVRAVLPVALDLSPTSRLTFDGRADRADTAAFVYDTGGQFPVREVALRLEPNQVVEGRLEARDDSDQAWQPVLTAEWYALTADGLTLASNARAVPPRARRYWRFLDAADATPAARVPQLEIGWVPQRLRVLAEGRPPYTLAVGSGLAAARAAPDAPDFLRNAAAELVGGAVAGAAFVLGGEDQRSAPRPVLPWQRVLLWAVLAAGAVLVLAMVRRLLRDFDG
ncbi:MAG: DUF3999 family protein [Gammaproteobacteria bacterium]|nr:DUF3999 family protein [Gammaproteobacteria bacterium]